MPSHIKESIRPEANENASDPNYPDRLVEWAGSATGGVRLVFRDQNGRPVKKQIKTNLVIKAEELAQKIFAGQLLPRLVMFAGGAGNGKTDTLEVILAGICNPELLEEFKADIRDRITKSGRKVIFLPKTSDKKYFPETVRQYDRISFVQDASESYESGDTASGLLAQDLDDLHRTHKNIRELLVLCVNRGVLYTAANEMESKKLDIGLIKLILRAIDPVNIDVDCWPVCPSTDLIGQNQFYLWPLDIDSICESLNKDQPSAVEQVLQDLDSRNWGQLEDFSSAHPLRFSRKLLAIPEFRKAFAQLFRQYELISGKTMNFRKLFSVLTYLFTGGWHPAEKKKPSEFSGRIIDLVDPDYENLKSAFNAYKHSLPYLLFPSLPDCERLSSHLDNLHNTSSCNALKGLEDFIGSISQPCRSGFPGASMFTGNETEWALIMDPARNSTIIEDPIFSNLESDLCLGLDCLEKYNDYIDDASKAVLRRIADINNELCIFSSDKQNADADCKWIGLWIGRWAAVIVKRSIFVWLLSQGKILTSNVGQIKIFNDAGDSAHDDPEEYAEAVRKFLFGPISIDVAGNNDEFVVHLAKGLCRPFSTDIGGASLAIRTEALKCNLLAESKLRPRGSILVIEFSLHEQKVRLPIAMAMHDFMERKKRGELFGSMPSALRGVVDTFRLQIDGLAMQDENAKYKLRLRNGESGTEFRISNISKKFGVKKV